MKTTCPLVGAHFRPPAKAILQVLPTGTSLALRAEPDNQYDPNAIQVLVSSKNIPQFQIEQLDLLAAGYGFSAAAIVEQEEWHLGYIPRDRNLEVRPALAGQAKLGFAPDGKPIVVLDWEG